MLFLSDIIVHDHHRLDFHVRIRLGAFPYLIDDFLRAVEHRTLIIFHAAISGDRLLCLTQRRSDHGQLTLTRDRVISGFELCLGSGQGLPRAICGRSGVAHGRNNRGIVRVALFKHLLLFHELFGMRRVRANEVRRLFFAVYFGEAYGLARAMLVGLRVVLARGGRVPCVCVDCRGRGGLSGSEACLASVLGRVYAALEEILFINAQKIRENSILFFRFILVFLNTPDQHSILVSGVRILF